MKADYSNTSLKNKIGIKPHARVVLLNHPEGYGSLLFPFPEGVSIFDELHKDADIIHFFTDSKGELEKKFPTLKEHLASNGSLWISWPKGSSKQKTDLNENSIREIGLSNNLVDVKVIAVDEIWSGLKFVYRVVDRT